MTNDSEVPGQLRYSKEHEWVRAEEGNVRLGITAFAVAQLGDVTLVSWDVEEGDTVEAGQVFGTVESVKALSDLFAPVSGVVKSINAALEDAPELVNDDCWGEGWMMVVEPSAASEVESLLDADAYREHIASEQD